MSIVGGDNLQKPIEKNVYFYKTVADPTFKLFEDNEQIRLYKIFSTVFYKGCITYVYNEENSTHRFEIISFDDSHIFGIYSKEEQSPNPLMQFRIRTTNETESIIPEGDPDKVLEYYTFFLVNFEKGLAATIYNKQASSIDKILQSYFFASNCNMSMIPYCMDNVKEAIKSFKRVSDISYTYNSNIASHEFKTMSELRNFDMEVESLKIKLKISRAGSRLLEDIIKHPSNKFTSFKIKGFSDDAAQQCFDTIKKSFMRTTKIIIGDEPKNNLQAIKNTLLLEISRIVNN
nr:MAG TPA: hypothetical protein [Caudoviricetes sp.]